MFGIIPVNKSAGLSSRHCVNRVQWLIKPHKVGHAGTLDPMATGVLVLCVGKATRLVEFIQQQAKCYRGTFLLGRSSPTEDLEGEVTELEDPPVPTRAEIEAVLPEFVGAIEQVPPVFSALKVKGKRSYKLARAGKEVELAARTIQIDDLRIASYDYPTLQLDIGCGSGTYVRSLGRDIARRVGTEAVMSALVRTAIGSYTLEDACTLDDISLDVLPDLILPPLSAVAHLPQLKLNAAEIEEIHHGRLLQDGQRLGVERIAGVDGEGRLMAILTPHKGRFLKPLRNFTTAYE